ncbi:stationary phase inducible protein CsiE [Trabulsiella odontotermitis]|uniref:stationary phase inducible protein CsiE n=1 Tax=Trabulsiella odontotermitis TaxID=379893 RepID=UPI000675BEC9|nr:stationary phase inducible protein CsiE [Trabulsiella odontotermitis]KNC90323.1 stationary phase inducible protein CsiE [Trabulsiella odontotermitis]
MMTMLDTPSALSSPQRRCQTLLMLSLPGQEITHQYISNVNNVDDDTARLDIADINDELQRYHRLTIATHDNGCYRIEGTPLDQRLCLLHWLRRALRLCPTFISHHYTPALKSQLKLAGIARTLYDDTNLQALINRCAHGLHRQFECRDLHFLRLYLQYCLLQHHLGLTPSFTAAQQNWTEARIEHQVAEEIVRHWQRRIHQLPHEDEHRFLTLLFMMLRTPDPIHDGHLHDRRLQRAISRLIDRFQGMAGRGFSDEQGLRDQLYIHLSQALNRSIFSIGIDNSLPEEINLLYPRLMRTTRIALHEFEEDFGIRFTEEESGLVAVIFGAWLMQESDLHEKQVVLLTGDNPYLESELERQLRELTLLPINIKNQSVEHFEKEGAPKDVTLVVTPYAITLPLFSPPLIHARDLLSEHQRQQICKMLET